MNDCKIYLSGKDAEDLMRGLGAALKAEGIKCKMPPKGLAAFSPEIVSLVTVGASSLVALVSAILTYLGSQNSSSTVEIRATDGATIKFPARAEAEELKRYLALLKGMEAKHIVIAAASAADAPKATKDNEPG